MRASEFTKQGVVESDNNNPVAQKIFFARSKIAPKAWSYDHVGFITQDGKQIQMSGHKGNEVYVTNTVTDDPEFPEQNIKVVSLPKSVSVPTTNTVNAENCGTFVANVLQANGIKGFDTQKLYSVMKTPRQQGVAEDTVDEMALSTYKTMGDFSKPGPFTGADKKLVPHPKNIEKATRFFEQTPFDFRLFFSHLKGTGKYSEHGPMSPDQIKQVFGQDAEEIINGSEDAITVVYVGNKGDAKVMLTPWMMAHRFGHAINAGARNKNWTAWGEAENYFFQTVNNLLDEHYGKVPATKPPGRNMLFQLTPEYNALFNAMGTQRSSTSGQIRRPYEFLYELFAQYLGTGKVTLNPLPTNLGYGRRVFGNPTKYMNIKPEYRDESERKQAADSLAYTMELLFNDVLSDSVGKIFVM